MSSLTAQFRLVKNKSPETALAVELWKLRLERTLKRKPK